MILLLLIPLSGLFPLTHCPRTTLFLCQDFPFTVSLHGTLFPPDLYLADSFSLFKFQLRLHFNQKCSLISLSLSSSYIQTHCIFCFIF